MTTSVRFCLSYDPFKLDFTAFKFDSCSTENAWFDMDIVMTLLVPVKVLYNVWLYDFYNMTLSTE